MHLVQGQSDGTSHAHPELAITNETPTPMSVSEGGKLSVTYTLVDMQSLRLGDGNLLGSFLGKDG